MFLYTLPSGQGKNQLVFGQLNNIFTVVSKKKLTFKWMKISSASSFESDINDQTLKVLLASYFYKIPFLRSLFKRLEIYQALLW